MTTLSISLPDNLADKRKDIAKVRDISLNKLLCEFSAQVLAEYEALPFFFSCSDTAK